MLHLTLKVLRTIPTSPVYMYDVFVQIKMCFFVIKMTEIYI